MTSSCLQRSPDLLIMSALLPLLRLGSIWQLQPSAFPIKGVVPAFQVSFGELGPSKSPTRHLCLLQDIQQLKNGLSIPICQFCPSSCWRDMCVMSKPYKTHISPPQLPSYKNPGQILRVHMCVRCLPPLPPSLHPRPLSKGRWEMGKGRESKRGELDGGEREKGK